MRFARVITPHDRQNPTLDRLLATADLDVVQLDYEWPHGYSGEGMVATGFLRQLKTLHKAMYLDPTLHVITNAGAGNVVGCMEAVAEFLCEHGSADLPMTAIRGANLLPRIGELIAAGVELRGTAAGRSVTGLPQPLRAANLELGAGPIATALREGSRLVIAGGYDAAAPAIASAVSALRWSWNQRDPLAQLAVAAHFSDTLLELNTENALAIQSSLGECLETEHLHSDLLKIADVDGIIFHADVTCDIKDFTLRQDQPGRFCIDGVIGLGLSEVWRLRLISVENTSTVCTIPREAVPISVDTRPAAEWK